MGFFLSKVVQVSLKQESVLIIEREIVSWDITDITRWFTGKDIINSNIAGSILARGCPCHSITGAS